MTALNDRQQAGVFLDRDGVVNRARVLGGRPFPPGRLEDFEILPGVVEACAAFRRAGFRVLVVTNQPDIARGNTTQRAIDSLHGYLLSRIAVDAILVCPHDDRDRCGCRKPQPGLLLEGADRFGIALDRSVMVGDRWKDVEAGKHAGCTTVFIDAGYQEPRPDHPDLTVPALAEAVPWILRRCSSKGT